MRNVGIYWIFLSQNKSNWSEITRKFHTKFGRREGPSLPVTHKFIAKVREISFIANALRHQLVCVVCTLENIQVAAENVSASPSTSALYRSQEEHFKHQFMSNIAKKISV